MKKSLRYKWLSVFVAAAMMSMSVLSFVPLPVAHAGTLSYTLEILNTTAGKTPKFIGENVTNASGISWTDSNKEWIKNSRMNAMRLWLNVWNYEPTNDNGPYGNNVNSLSTFNAAKNAVLANPENNSYINWTAFNNRIASEGLDDGLAFLSSAGIEPITVLRGDAQNIWFPNTLSGWADYWEWWEFCFAMSYYVYKNYGFTYFEIANEPNINGITAQDYVKIAQYASDAVSSAVHVVNANADPEIMTPALSAVPEHTNPTDEQYLADTLNLHGSGIDTNTGDSYSKYISYHAYRDSTSPDPSDPNTPYQVAELERIKDVIQNNNPDGWVEDMFVTEMNSGLTRDSDDPLQNARLAHLFMQMINHGKSYDSSTSWMKGILKFKFDETNGGSVFPGSPEYTGPHLNYFTFDEVAQAAQRIKDIMQINTTIPEDQVLVSRDPTYYYILFSNLSSTDTSKITLDTSAIGITSAPAHFETTNANQEGTRWDKQIANGSLVYYVSPETVTLVKIPRSYTAKTISSISISPSAAINVNLYGAKEFTATAHYTDGSTKNITDLVNWSSSNNSNVNMLSTGLAYGVTSGTSASISCSYDGVTSNSVVFNVN